MKTIKGPGIFLAQFAGDKAPFHNLEAICAWAESLGFKGIQIPTNTDQFIDLKLTAESQTYADEIRGRVNDAGLEITELSTHLQGQLVAVHPAYDIQFDAFAPAEVKNAPKARQEWAVQQLLYAAKASARLGLTAHATFSGSLLWPQVFPWPQRPNSLVDDGFTELARRWMPILNTFGENGVTCCYEIHPGEDLHDGVSYERFLEKVNQHPAACLLYDPSHLLLQCIDYLTYIDHYHERIKAFHVKDAEFNPTGKQGVYGGFENWLTRAGRFRSVGDGQVDFRGIFSKLTQYGYEGWAVLEWECCLKDAETGAEEGAGFIKSHIIPIAKKAFDDFAAVEVNQDINRKILGL